MTAANPTILTSSTDMLLLWYLVLRKVPPYHRRPDFPPPYLEAPGCSAVSFLASERGEGDIMIEDVDSFMILLS